MKLNNRAQNLLSRTIELVYTTSIDHDAADEQLIIANKEASMKNTHMDTYTPVNN